MQDSHTAPCVVGTPVPAPTPGMVRTLDAGAVMVKGIKLARQEAREALDDAFRHQHYTFPTLSIRQAHILLVLIGEGMHTPVMVDDKPVTGDEWIELIKTLVDVRS